MGGVLSCIPPAKEFKLIHEFKVPVPPVPGGHVEGVPAVGGNAQFVATSATPLIVPVVPDVTAKFENW